ncbi:MAG: glycosyltransferase family 25 protein [Alphaproteobacteria bacterium]|nr:glycosyltransferase family 25 protein [Alphaproteobacteria bacterium]
MIPVLIISLEDETARRAAIAAHLKERGFEPEFFDAIDGRQMDVLKHPGYDSKQRRAAHGRDLKPGELGCLLSHRAAYEEIIKRGWPCALLLEDDARLHEDTLPVLESFIAQNIDFDIIRLLGSAKVARSPHRKIIPLYKDFHLTRMLTTPGGAHATLISRQGAEKLIKATEKFAFPIDTILGRCWETGINAYSVQPGLATQDLSFDSAIGEERHDKTIPLKGLQKAKFKLTRPLFKISEAIGKRLTFAKTRASDLALRKKFG